MKKKKDYNPDNSVLKEYQNKVNYDNHIHPNDNNNNFHNHDNIPYHFDYINKYQTKFHIAAKYWLRNFNLLQLYKFLIFYPNHKNFDSINRKNILFIFLLFLYIDHISSIYLILIMIIMIPIDYFILLLIRIFVYFICFILCIHFIYIFYKILFLKIKLMYQQ